MKKILVYLICVLITTSGFATPNPELKKAFAQTFPAATHVNWSDDKDGYFVSFSEGGNLRKVFYDKTGNFVCSWRYSDGYDLPPTVSSVLLKNYKDFKIIGVTELSTSSYCFYEIKLATGKYWYSTKISPYGEILEKKKYNKF